MTFDVRYIYIYIHINNNMNAFIVVDALMLQEFEKAFWDRVDKNEDASLYSRFEFPEIKIN